MTKRKGTPARGKNTVTIDLDALRKAVEELAPAGPHIMLMEKLLRRDGTLEEGLERALVRNLSLNMHTVLASAEAYRIKEALTRLAAFMDLLATAVNGGAAWDNIAPEHLITLLDAAVEKLYSTKNLLEQCKLKQ